MRQCNKLRFFLPPAYTKTISCQAQSLFRAPLDEGDLEFSSKGPRIEYCVLSAKLLSGASKRQSYMQRCHGARRTNEEPQSKRGAHPVNDVLRKCRHCVCVVRVSRRRPCHSLRLAHPDSNHAVVRGLFSVFIWLHLLARIVGMTSLLVRSRKHTC